MFDHDPPPLFVPDLTKPAGAAVDADGTVACVTCRTRLPLAKADVVGQGYRCPPCSHRAQIETLASGVTDVHSNLSAEDRNALRSAGLQMILPGIGMIVLGAVLIPVFRRLPFYLMAAGIGACIMQGRRPHEHRPLIAVLMQVGRSA